MAMLVSYFWLASMLIITNNTFRAKKTDIATIYVSVASACLISAVVRFFNLGIVRTYELAISLNFPINYLMLWIAASLVVYFLYPITREFYANIVFYIIYFLYIVMEMNLSDKILLFAMFTLGASAAQFVFYTIQKHWLKYKAASTELTMHIDKYVLICAQWIVFGIMVLFGS